MKKTIMWLTRFEWLPIALCIVVASVFATENIYDSDIPWHLAAGNYILQHHSVPHTDSFSWTESGSQWIAHEWMFECILTWMANKFQFYGIAAVMMGFHLITMFAMYKVAKLFSKNTVVASVATFAGSIASIIFWVARPQIASYMMFALFLYLLKVYSTGKRYPLYVLPLLLVVWANLHGSAIIGVGMMVFELVLAFVPSFWRFKRVFIPLPLRWKLVISTIIGTVASVLLNPNGIKAYTYTLYSSNKILSDHILEWMSPNFHRGYYEFFILPAIALFVFGMVGKKGEMPLREVVYFGGTLGLFLIHQRFIPYTAITFAPVVAYLLKDWKTTLNRPSKLTRLLTGAALVFAIGVLVYIVPRGEGAVESHWDKNAMPIAAVNFMKQHGMTERVLNVYQYGGYMIYAGMKPFVDGRTDIYLHDNTMKDYLDMEFISPDITKLMNQYNFHYVLWTRNTPLAVYLSNQPGWRVAYQDTTAVVFERIHH